MALQTEILMRFYFNDDINYNKYIIEIKSFFTINYADNTIYNVKTSTNSLESYDISSSKLGFHI